MARQLQVQQPSQLILCHALAHRKHSASSRSCWVRGISMKLLKSTYAQAHHRAISSQMLPPLCGRNPLSSKNQMSSWCFFFFFLSSSSLLWRYCLQDPFKLTANYTLITSLPIPGIYSHLLSKCCILKYFALILPQILSITKILSFPWRHCSLSRSKAGNMSLVNTRW